MNSKLFLLAFSATFLTGIALAGDKTTDSWDITYILGTGATFSLGQALPKDMEKNLDKIVKIPQFQSTLYFANGKQLQSKQDPEGKGKPVCEVVVTNGAGRMMFFAATPLTVVKAPYWNMDKSESFDLDASKQTDKAGNANLVVINKVTCSQPMVKEGRSNLTLGDVKKAFGKFASIQVFSGALSMNQPAPQNPAPPVDNGPVNVPKPDPAPAAPVPAPDAPDPAAAAPAPAPAPAQAAPAAAAPAPAPAIAGAAN